MTRGDTKSQFEGQTLLILLKIIIHEYLVKTLHQHSILETAQGIRMMGC